MWMEREPDEIIGPEGQPYLLRWFLFRFHIIWIYLHLFLRDDEDRALHDHPAPSLSFAFGDYSEMILDQKTGEKHIIRRKAYRFVYRSAEHTHRIILFKDKDRKPIPVCTIFIFFGRKKRQWGFWCGDTRFVRWQDFCDERDNGKVGKGCG